jgi:hypothetical protein
MRSNRALKPTVGIPAQAAIDTTDINGNAVDCRGYGVYEAILNLGTPSASDTLAVRIQETTEDPASPGNPLAAGWGDVPGATTGAVAAAGQKVIQIECQRRKAFMRPVATAAGTTISIPFAVTVVRRQGARTQPETAPDVVVGFD